MDPTQECEREERNRMVRFVWALGERKSSAAAGGSWDVQAVLQCTHHAKGANMLTGEVNTTGYFSATLNQEETEDREHGKVTSFKLFSGLGVMREPVTRYSKKRLDEFAERALERLRSAAEQELVVAQFKVMPDEAKKAAA